MFQKFWGVVLYRFLPSAGLQADFASSFVLFMCTSASYLAVGGHEPLVWATFNQADQTLNSETVAGRDNKNVFKGTGRFK